MSKFGERVCVFKWNIRFYNFKEWYRFYFLDLWDLKIMILNNGKDVGKIGIFINFVKECWRFLEW